VHPDRTPGPVADLIREAGLPLELVQAAPVPRRLVPVRPAVARRILSVVRDRGVELVHAYEYPLTLDAFYGAQLRTGVGLACTIYGMDVPRWLPREASMVVGTRELADLACTFRGRPTTLIEPPVNTAADDPAIVDPLAFRAAHGLHPDDTVVGVVSRLEPDMKEEGIARAIGAIALLAPERRPAGRLRLVIVGDGPSRPRLADAAAAVNAQLDDEAVVLTGAIRDPRAAYAAFDIALGMGGSAIRALAFARPLVVLGIGGYARPFTEETAAEFLSAGFYGVGAGPSMPEELAAHLRPLTSAAPEQRARLGAYGRQVVLERFSLDAAAARLDAVYAEALAASASRGRTLTEAARPAAYRAGSELISERAKARIRPLLRRPVAEVVA
jgi:glycosyltransferase involved in cell wall biosynthesis